MEYPEISGSQIINMSNAINGAMLDLWKGAYKVFQTDRSIIGEAIWGYTFFDKYGSVGQRPKWIYF